MTYDEACHYLRVTSALLKWFTRYAAKSDGRKLAEVGNGQFDKAELDAFDAHLRTVWSSKNVPTGIREELLVEACGRCALCQDPCEKLEMAHIERKAVEVSFYFQHPANLIPLCGTCHGRYDDPVLRSVNLGVIQAAKQRLVSRKMETIDRDVERALAVQDAVEHVKVELLAQARRLGSAQPANLWVGGGTNLLSAAIDSLNASPMNLDEIQPSIVLGMLSGSMGSNAPVTRAVLDGYAQEASGDVSEAPPTWDLIDDCEPKEHECVCGELKDTVDYECEECGHTGTETNPPVGVEENAHGRLVPVYDDMRGRSTDPLQCEECESENLIVSYPESFCSRCAYRLSRDD